MNYYLVLILNLSVLFPSILGWVHFKKVDSAFYPFIYIVWLGCINEIVSNTVMYYGYYNTVNFNIHLLLEAFLLLFLFKKWYLFNRSKKIFYILFIGYAITWTLETIFISKLVSAFDSYFRILYCFISVLMSISIINFLLMSERKLLLKNSIFLICCAFVLFYTLSVLTEVFFLYGLQLSNSFILYINRIVVFTNFFCNLIYALALLWMPKKLAFTLQY